VLSRAPFSIDFTASAASVLAMRDWRRIFAVHSAVGLADAERVRQDLVSGFGSNKNRAEQSMELLGFVKL
jgi:predicted transcriptional regulator